MWLGSHSYVILLVARALSLSLFVCPTDCLSDCLWLINVMCSILCWFGFCCVVRCEST